MSDRTYEIGLSSGQDSLNFKFCDLSEALTFISCTLKHFEGRETDNGANTLLVEINQIYDF